MRGDAGRSGHHPLPRRRLLQEGPPATPPRVPPAPGADFGSAAIAPAAPPPPRRAPRPPPPRPPAGGSGPTPRGRRGWSAGRRGGGAGPPRGGARTQMAGSARSGHLPCPQWPSRRMLVLTPLSSLLTFQGPLQHPSIRRFSPGSPDAQGVCKQNSGALWT
ncbi:unnamed protein product [Nyctereutes procyonoides]|uniref:(raccoon dog) hypothetical protein n=1 Tax=Nyctereutes procyonoides TaxID=34880 RepID=A0A811ZA30_NYCPR|nr:unnamed protein product [Nyctereutes procyonoides]